MATITDTPAVNAAIKDAQSLPALVATLQTVDPAMAQQIEGKALLASKTPWGTLLTAAVAYVAARYGLGFDQTTDALIAGVGVLVGSYAMRAVTSSPISGWFTKKSTTTTKVS